MMSGTHSIFDGTNEVTVPVPVSGTENVMVPVIRAIVNNADGSDSFLLQRRSIDTEPVFGLLELPGGTWRAGESPQDAIAREVLEETGILLESISGIVVDRLDARRSIATVKPLAVIAGVDGAFPAVHVIVVASGSGSPRPADGESSDVRWWSIEEVRVEVEDRPMAFVPSTLAAVCAYLDSIESESG
jgi:ADP-ribose pyrophosphatase YjhB (NUDIX family)